MAAVVVVRAEVALIEGIMWCGGGGGGAGVSGGGGGACGCWCEWERWRGDDASRGGSGVSRGGEVEMAEVEVVWVEVKAEHVAAVVVA